MKRLIVLTLLLLSATPGFATTYCFWIGPDGGDWWDAKNWYNGVRPETSDDVARLGSTYGKGGRVVLTHPETLACNYILVEGTTAYTLDLAGGTLAMGGTWMQNTSTIQVCDSAHLTISNGTVSNTCYLVTSTARLDFDNCRNIRTLTNARVDATTTESPVSMTIAENTNTFQTLYFPMYQRLLVAGGLTRIGAIYGADRYDSSRHSQYETPIAVSGGTLTITDEDLAEAGRHSQGVGIHVRNCGIVDNLAKGSAMWMGHKNRTYKWRVEDHALFKTYGIYMCLDGANAQAHIELAGGRMQLHSSMGGLGAGAKNYGRTTSIYLNGGILECDPSDAMTLSGTEVSATGNHYLYLGATRARIRNNSNKSVTISQAGFTPKGTADGGIALEGYGPVTPSATSAHTGGTTIRGNVTAGSASTRAFGTGAFTLTDGGQYASTYSGEQTIPALAVSNAALVHVDYEENRIKAASLTAQNGGLLLIEATRTSVLNFGTTGHAGFALETAPTCHANGMPKAPVFLMSNETSADTYNNGCNEMRPLSWNATAGCFVNAPYHVGLEGATDSDFVYVDANTNLTADQAVQGYFVRATVNGQGKTISFGEGSDPAVFVLQANSRGNSGSYSNGTIDFGTHPGIIGWGGNVSGLDTGAVQYNAYFSGSAGVTFAGYRSGGFRLYRTGNYTGGTRVLTGSLILLASGSYHGGFPTDKPVLVAGGEYTGASVRFCDEARTYANDFKISGFGVGAFGAKRGALSFEKNATISGQVTLVGDARITADTGCTGTMGKSINGTGDLYAAGAGALKLGGVAIDGDLHIEGAVTISGDIATNTRFLFLEDGATLTFDNAGDLTVDATIVGKGTIVLAGAGKVAFADLGVFEGTIDLCGNDKAQLAGLQGFCRVVNSRRATATATLTITDDAARAKRFFGTMGDGITLNITGTLREGRYASVTPATDLILNGGVVELGQAQTFATLKGHGAVTGDVMSVEGETQPDGDAKIALTFAKYPTLTTLAPGWKLKADGLGAIIKKMAGFLVQIY